MEKTTRITAEKISALVQNFILNSPLNSLGNQRGEPAWDSFLVGFSSGEDPIWQQYKEYVGAFHWTPWEVFNQHCPQNNVSADQLTVISWILPQRNLIRATNGKAKKYPSEEWARIRVHGEKFNIALREHLVKKMEEAGHAAVAPMLASNWTIVNSQRFSYASTWSERHAAYAAGLGTFGLCDGLITARGKAMRAGSIVAKIAIPPTPRPYADHHAWCLYYAQGTCGKCIDRCPVRAITEAGHDKEKCRQHLAKSRGYVKKTYQFEGYGCGLCQVGVPCEAGIPVRAARQALERGELPLPPPPLA
ncbi:MAG: epoxyqueuosine reductase [Proteobacteria bacterium]|nr:epoxyqueuosine reductase [Pseudomonadota bacterium]